MNRILQKRRANGRLRGLGHHGLQEVLGYLLFRPKVVRHHASCTPDDQEDCGQRIKRPFGRFESGGRHLFPCAVTVIGGL